MPLIPPPSILRIVINLPVVVLEDDAISDIKRMLKAICSNDDKLSSIYKEEL